MASLLRRIAIDVSPLRGSRDFRRLWSGLLLTGVGYHFTVVATFIQVYDLTGSTTAVGLVGLVGLAGIVIGIVGGGTFIDAIDRRTTLLWSQVAAGAGSGLLLIGAMLDRPPLWLLYVAVALISGVSAIDSSVRNATVPRLVGRDQLPSALALNQVVMNATALLGPALAGVVIARFGLVAAYTVDVLSYIVMFAIVWTIRPVPPEGAGRQDTGWSAVRQGFAYLRGRRVLQAAFGADLVAMIFGMPRALFPLIAFSQFGEGATVVGLLFAAPAVGAVLGALTGGWVRRVHHQGLAVLWAVVVWGASIAAFGLVGDRLVLALRLAGGRRRCRRDLGDLPGNDHPALGARSPPWSPRQHQLPRGGGWTPPGRPRGRRGGSPVLADGLDRVRWTVVHRRGGAHRLDGALVPKVRGVMTGRGHRPSRAPGSRAASVPPGSGASVPSDPVRGT